MISRFINLFTSKDAKKIFSHEADGELCAYCGKPMHTKQGVIQVRRGGKMHSKCWPDYFERRVQEIAEKYRSQEGKSDER